MTGDSVDLIDGTSIQLPTEAYYLSGKAFELENRGVTPEIIVSVPPVATKQAIKKLDSSIPGLAGHPCEDPQLSRAIEEAVKRLRSFETKAVKSTEENYKPINFDDLVEDAEKKLKKSC